MATEGIISDVGAIYKRLFHHRPVIQNEVHFFVREFEAKRGNSDLQCLQSCVSMVSELETVYLEDISTTRPHFKAIHNLSEKVSELGNTILSREKPDTGVSSSEQEKRDREVEELREQLERETEVYKAETEVELQRLKEEIRELNEARAKLRTVSVGSSAELTLSRNNSNFDSIELSTGEQDKEKEAGEEHDEDLEEEKDEEIGEGDVAAEVTEVSEEVARGQEEDEPAET